MMQYIYWTVLTMDRHEAKRQIHEKQNHDALRNKAMRDETVRQGAMKDSRETQSRHEVCFLGFCLGIISLARQRVTEPG